MDRDTDMTDEFDGEDVPPRPNDGEWKTVTSISVNQGGRILVDASDAKRHGFEKDTPVDVVVYTDDGRAIPLHAVEVGTQYRIGIPSGKERKFDLSGETVDVHIREANIE